MPDAPEITLEAEVRKLANILRGSVKNPGARPHGIIMPDGSVDRGPGIDLAVEMILKIAETAEAIADRAAAHRARQQGGEHGELA